MLFYNTLHFFYLKNFPKFKKKKKDLGSGSKSLLKGFGFIPLVEKTEKKNQTKVIKDICGCQK